MARPGRPSVHQPQPRRQARCLPARDAADACLAARTSRRIRTRAAARAAAHVGRHLRLRGLRHRAPHRAAAQHAARRAQYPRQHPDPPHGDGDLRRGEGRDLHRDAGARQRAPIGGEGLQGRDQAAQGGRHRARCAAPARPAGGARQAAGTQAGLQHDARPVQGHGAAGEGLHRRRRHLPGRALPTLLRPLRAAALCALPGAQAHQPLAVSLSSRLRRLRARRLEPGDPGARAQWRGHDPPHRRHRPARAGRGRGPGAGRGAPERPQGAGRASHAARSGPQRRGARRPDRLGQRDGALLHRALQPRHAHRLQRCRAACQDARRGRRADGGVPRRHRLWRTQGARHGDHRRVGEVQTRAVCRLRRLLLGVGTDG